VTAVAIAFVIVAGIAGAAQAAIMGKLGERVGSLEALAFATLLTALLAGALLLVARQSLSGYASAARQPPWLWSAAAMGAWIVLSITIAAPRIGTTATIGIIVAGNLAFAAVIDQFGLFGLEQRSIGWERVGGIALLGAGAALSLKR
jgi:bacterial/archaeal transporter family-2 protein